MIYTILIWCGTCGVIINWVANLALNILIENLKFDSFWNFSYDAKLYCQFNSSNMGSIKRLIPSFKPKKGSTAKIYIQNSEICNIGEQRNKGPKANNKLTCSRVSEPVS